jgi:hypothetical protein
MPRRIADYPDLFYFWKNISRFGSIISVVGVLYFIFIVWERLYVERQIIGVVCKVSKTEFNWLCFPIYSHTYMERTAYLNQ